MGGQLIAYTVCKIVSLNKVSSQYIKLALSPCHIYVVPNPGPHSPPEILSLISIQGLTD